MASAINRSANGRESSINEFLLESGHRYAERNIEVSTCHSHAWGLATQPVFHPRRGDFKPMNGATSLHESPGPSRDHLSVVLIVKFTRRDLRPASSARAWKTGPSDWRTS